MEAHTRESTESVAPEAIEPDGMRHGVYARMAESAYRFDFFQAVRLLEQYFSEAPAPGTTTASADHRIRFRPDAGLTFPATDLKRILWHNEPDSHVEVIATFMGLYGIGSPLPYYLYDTLATEDEETLPYRDFLDIFNHRLYAFFYRAWKKYRPIVVRPEGLGQQHEHRFLSLAGVGTFGARDALPVAPLRYASLAGWFGRCTRSAEGLEAVVGTLFNLPVEVVQNVPRWVPLPSRRSLGANGSGMQLGVAATIGERVYDRSSKFRLRIGPLGLAEYVALLPGGKRADALYRIVRFYAPDHLAFDVELQVRSDELPRSRLGHQSARLGLTLCLGRPTEAIYTRRVDYEC